MVRYAKPRTVDEALGLLADGDWWILAGGTDFYPALGALPLKRDVLDINGLDELDRISATGDGVTFGARASWTRVVRASLPPAFNALKAAAREVGSVQIQNRATVAGNLCNASPAADGVPPLLALDAEVELRSAKTTRRLPLADFVLGNRETARRPDELVTAIHVPRHAVSGRSAFVKLGARRYLVISIAMAAANVEIGADGMIASARIAVGACSPVARRMPALEAALVGRPADASLLDLFDDAHFAGLTPIDDVRGTSGYRHAAAREIVGRALLAAIGANDEGEQAA
ncbi:xanthine dehydrogenase family protein subunit M [Mesorhizobium sp. Z1-4]|uniref:FAD binding domain-containing protein n=1 Tax=Mesorhizobium sp. Z1-4 TaxID=2448478 RepID=UPI000FD8EDEF|nr:xanthine dehydrogenase family protein subunit M [Mesorhizobium sp. Z1-4]